MIRLLFGSRSVVVIGQKSQHRLRPEIAPKSKQRRHLRDLLRRVAGVGRIARDVTLLGCQENYATLRRKHFRVRRLDSTRHNNISTNESLRAVEWADDRAH